MDGSCLGSTSAKRSDAVVGGGFDANGGGSIHDRVIAAT